jgi:hypothetical protein
MLAVAGFGFGRAGEGCVRCYTGFGVVSFFGAGFGPIPNRPTGLI